MPRLVAVLLLSLSLSLSSPAHAAPVSAPAPKLDLNAADESDLARLPGMTKELAKFIVVRRDARGPYTAVEELQPVIGRDAFEKLRELVTVGGGEGGGVDTQPPLGPGWTCDVVEAVDGRTLKLRCGAREETLRLVRVATPEKGQPGFARAVEGLREIVKGGKVYVFFERDMAPEKDADGRTLGWAQAVTAGMTVNEQLVFDGWSKAPAAETSCRRCAELRDQESAAKTSWVGFWQRQGWKPQDRRARD
jgi:endonuclease YncB( thermonuclease family)